MTTSDTELAKKANGGDKAAFEALLSRHYDMLYRVAYRLLANQHDAEDIAHDICIALPGKLTKFNGRSKFTTWLYKVAVNATRDHIRRNKTAERANNTWGELTVMQLADTTEQKENSKWLYTALDNLGDDLRETAMLVVAEGLNHAEAASILDIKESTVSWRMHEIRKKLKILSGTENDG